MFRYALILLWTLLLCTSCNHLLYPAERQMFVNKNFLKPVPQDVLIPIPNSKDQNIHAWLFEAQSKIKKGIVVHFHGNGENLSTHFQFFLWMTQLGFDYLIFDYRGYGQSSLEEAETKNTIEDGKAVLQYVKNKMEQLPVIAIGQSLGSNVLVRSLQEIEQEYYPNLVVLDSSFLSYQQAARSVLSQKWFLYPLKPFTYFLISDEHSALKTIEKNPKIPAIFFHGTNDQIIKFELGLENYKNWSGPKVFIENKEGVHISAFADFKFKFNKEILLNCIDMLKNIESFTKCHKF